MLRRVRSRTDMGGLYERLMGVKSGEYGLDSTAETIWERIPIPEWSGGTDE
jgi:hypothetical protein